MDRIYEFDTVDGIHTDFITKNISGDKKLIFYKTTDSTNLRLKEMCKENAKSGTVVISEYQTAGRGRLGRSFFSPSDSGIYMSMLLRPTKDTDVGMITAHTAVAVCNALEKASCQRFEIKWVNDILKDGKKVCGILAESCLGNDISPYIIVGVGINVYPPTEGFPEDIENTAGYVFDERMENGRNIIISQIINNFYSYSDNFIEEYKRKSAVVGKKVTVHQNGSVRNAYAVCINDKCGLVVRYENGDAEELSFGEISIRL